MLPFLGELSDGVENAEGIPAGVVGATRGIAFRAATTQPRPTNVIYGRAGIKRGVKGGNCRSHA